MRPRFSLFRDYGLRQGTQVVLEPLESGIARRALAAVAREVQAFFAGAAPAAAPG
jgi:hypothetical protein